MDRLENFEGLNLIDKAVGYLVGRDFSHNNPILSQYQPGVTDNQDDCPIFFQANVFGGRIQANAVFVNHPLTEINKDKKILDYIANPVRQKKIKRPLGDLNIFYVAFRCL